MAMIQNLAMVGALLAASPAFAHAFIERTSPAAGADLRVSPKSVRIVFTEGVEPHFSTIEVRTASGTRLTTAAPHADGGIETLVVDLPTLPPGTYTVIWHATSVDTHKTEGKYTFTVLP